MGSKLIEIASFGPYDAKRYGRPWLAKLKGNPGTTKLTYEFQESAFAGDPENGGKLMGHLNDGGLHFLRSERFSRGMYYPMDRSILKRRVKTDIKSRYRNDPMFMRKTRFLIIVF